MHITIETVEPYLIRCRQCGDWMWDKDGSLTVSVNEDVKDNRSRLLIGLHEMVEAILCQKAGITDDQVTAFDMQFEAERAAGKHSVESENGDDPRAPYHQQHIESTAVEMMMCSLLGMTWKEHTYEIEATL